MLRHIFFQLGFNVRGRPWHDKLTDSLSAATTCESAAFLSSSFSPTTTKAPDMNEKFAPAIEVLKEEIADHERQARELKKLVNALAKKAGGPELYANVEADESTASIGSIKADTFYGKVIGTAASEY